ncbi:MAG: proton-conducting transporter transmembrane domain-containing protein [Gammaproteobacteria bacterium]
MLWNLVVILLAVTALASAGCWLTPNARIAEGLNFGAAAIDCTLVVILLARTPARGIETLDGYLLLDPLGLWVMLCTALVYLLASLHAIGYMRGMHEESARLNRFYGLFSAFALALFLAPLQNNPGLFWISIELTTIVSAFLVAFQRAPETIEAAWKYVIIASAGLSLALLGTVLFYWAGTFAAGPSYNMTWARFATLAPAVNPTLILLAFLLVLTGFGTKVGLAPMHTWLPDAHSEAPAPVSALLSGALLNCAMLGVVRYLLVLRQTRVYPLAQTILVAFGALSLLVAALFITRQTLIKRLAAYSSLEHMGIMAIGFGFGAPFGVIGALYQMLNHSLTKSAVFFGAGNAMHAYHSKQIAKIRRVLDYFPMSGALWLAAAVAITGAPPFGLFWGEITLLRGGMASANTWAVAWTGVFLIVIFIGFLKHFRVMYFGREPAEPPDTTLHWTQVAPLALAVGTVLVLGLWWPHPIWVYLSAIARHFEPT